MTGTLPWPDQHRPTTVGELRAAIAHLPDDMPCASVWERCASPCTAADNGETPHEPSYGFSKEPAGLLSPTQQAFCREYLVDLNATQAYRRANPTQAPESANANAYRLMVNDGVRAEIQRLMDERAVITGFAADRVLFKWIEQALADPRELAMIRVGSCRHCWGVHHQHQYTESEWDNALSAHADAQAEARQLHIKQGGTAETFVAEPCPKRGGTGYKPNRPPNPDCPECHGDGRARVVLRNQTALSPGALAMFGGVKSGKDGVQIIFNDSRKHALQQIALHLGMFNGDRAKTIEDPLDKLLEEIQGAHGAGSTLPIVWDPEDDPDDVVSPPVKVAQKSAPGADVSAQQPRKTWRKT